jgi:ornithine cyclodeaminase
MRFARRAATELRLPALPAESASATLSGADLVILASRATSQVIDASDVAPGAHVVTVGPKTVEGHEAPDGLADGASIVTCDSPAQTSCYDAEFFTRRPLVHLGAVLTGSRQGRQGRDDITLHCSAGLAGTEVVLAQHVLRWHRQSAQGLAESPEVG